MKSQKSTLMELRISVIFSPVIPSGILESPPSLPSGNSVDPNFVTDFALDSDFTGQIPDAPIVPGGTLEIIFALLGPLTDVTDAIESGALRLGLHVRSINVLGCVSELENECDSSESFVTNVPVPAAVWLLGTVLIGLIGFSRRNQSGNAGG